MTSTQTARDAVLDAARLLLARLGVSAEDLLASTPATVAPTFAEYVPVVAAAVTDGTRRVYSSYWNLVLRHWAERPIDEPVPSEIQQLAEQAKANVVVRRNGRGGPQRRTGHERCGVHHGSG